MMEKKIENLEKIKNPIIGLIAGYIIGYLVISNWRAYIKIGCDKPFYYTAEGNSLQVSQILAYLIGLALLIFGIKERIAFWFGLGWLLAYHSLIDLSIVIEVLRKNKLDFSLNFNN